MDVSDMVRPRNRHSSGLARRRLHRRIICSYPPPPVAWLRCRYFRLAIRLSLRRVYSAPSSPVAFDASSRPPKILRSRALGREYSTETSVTPTRSLMDASGLACGKYDRRSGRSLLNDYDPLVHVHPARVAKLPCLGKRDRDRDDLVERQLLFQGVFLVDV